VQCLGSEDRTGSVTIVGAVSPPGGDFSDPVTGATLGIVQSYWELDKRLAQRKHFPAVNWLTSFSKYEHQLESYYENLEGCGDFARLVTQAKELLQNENDLMEIVQLVGRDSLAESEKVTLEVAKLIKEDFLQQYTTKEEDRYCPFYKTVWMLRNILTFFNLAQQAVARGKEREVSWSEIKQTMSSLLYKLSMMKYEHPMQGEETLVREYKQLHAELYLAFKALEEA